METSRSRDGGSNIRGHSVSQSYCRLFSFWMHQSRVLKSFPLLSLQCYSKQIDLEFIIQLVKIIFWD